MRSTYLKAAINPPPPQTNKKRIGNVYIFPHALTYVSQQMLLFRVILLVSVFIHLPFQDEHYSNYITTSTPELFSPSVKRRALGNPETKCLLIGFREEQSKAARIGAFMLVRGVRGRRKVQIANFLL